MAPFLCCKSCLTVIINLREYTEGLKFKCKRSSSSKEIYHVMAYDMHETEILVHFQVILFSPIFSPKPLSCDKVKF